MELIERISASPDICFGKPCIKGTRIWVSLVLSYLAEGDSVDDVLCSYPQISQEDVRASLAYAAAMSRNNYVE